MKRDFKVGIISETDFNNKVMEILENAEKGIIPETPIERVYIWRHENLSGANHP
jgi:hypothetical protein